MDRPLDDMTRDEALEELHGEAGLVEGRVDGATAEHRAIPLGSDSGLDKHTRVRLRLEERAVAARYMSDPARMWPYTALTLGCFAAWLALFPLTMMGVVPLWAGFVSPP